jgi:hypothetical protein
MADEIERKRAALACRSDDVLAEFLSDIRVIGVKGIETLRAQGTDEGKRQLITAVRAGQHAELALSARTYRQKDGVPNRRFLRHNPDKLEAFAKSFVGMPMLRDHASWSTAARIGTITSSELSTHGGTGWSSIDMGLHVVKPEAVISVLDGTLDRFSIGWASTGPVTCSVHNCDVRKRGSCGCWPGDTVEVDGKPQIVEYQFESAEGIEVSAVNVPAVTGTKITDVRAALAAELGFETPREEIPMQLTRLAAALGLAALTAADEDRAVQTVEARERASTQERTARLAAEQERDTARARIKELETELATARSAGAKASIDALLEGAYRDGKLRYGRDSEGAAIPSRFEPMLRKLATSEGIEALRAEIAGMPQVVPVGQRQLNDATEQERDDELIDLDPALESVARQLNLKPEDVRAQARRHYGEEG